MYHNEPVTTIFLQHRFYGFPFSSQWPNAHTLSYPLKHYSPVAVVEKCTIYLETSASSIADGVSIRRVGHLKESVKRMELGLESQCIVEVIAKFFFNK